MTEADLPAAYELSKAVRWPHRLKDWQFVLSVGAGLSAFFGDRLVGTAMWWTYGDQQTRIGMVIVDPTIQRAGVGRSLMRMIIERIQTPTIVLNATKEGETLYRQIGFQPIGEIIQHQGASFTAPLVELGPNMRVRPMGRNDAANLIALDTAAFGVERATLINQLIAEGDAVLLDEGDRTVGFAFYRRFGRGHLIGPVVAKDAESAKALISHWIGSNPGLFQRIDVSRESGLSPWLEQQGLTCVDEVLTMARGAPPPTKAEFQVFGIANQALG